MRLPLALGLCALPTAVAVGDAACGGTAFTSAPEDAGPSSPAKGGDADATGPESFCALEAGTHTFCDDFDGLPLTSKWDSVDQGSGGTAVIDSAPDASFSPPGSLKSIAPPSIGIDTRGRVVKAFASASRIALSFEVQLDATPVKLGLGAVGGDSIVAIQVGPAYAIGLRAHTDEVGFFEQATEDSGATDTLTSKDLVATPTLMGWTQVVITIDLAHANLSIAIGGVQIVNGAPITPPSGQDLTVELGAFSHNQSQALAAHYDNVTIDITP